MPPPLSYGYAAFQSNDYDDFLPVIRRMRELGFRWVTLFPTWQVFRPFTIDAARTPPLEMIAAAVETALRAGLNVKVEPHLDWAQMYEEAAEWRGHMSFDPLASGYAELVTDSLAGLLAAASEAHRGPRILLTLGAELDRSLRELPAAWDELRHRYAGLPIELGHNLNHDYTSFGPLHLGYLSALDYVSDSFYPAIDFGRPPHWWHDATTNAHVNEIAAKFEAAARRLAKGFPDGPAFQIGEFGLGSTRVSRPWEVRPDTFGNMEAGPLELRRKFYLGYLRFLERFPSDQPCTFWTAGYFDFAGVFPKTDAHFKDANLIAAIEDYNGLGGSR